MFVKTRQLEAFGRKVTATAGHMMGDTQLTQHYHNALGDLHRELRRPLVQRSLFTLSQASPRELYRSTIAVSEIQHRALSYLPDDLLSNIPENRSAYSLFQGFQATIPESREASRDREKGRKGKRRLTPRGRKLVQGADADPDNEGPPALVELRNEKFSLGHKLEMLGVRKNMCSAEIREIDTKIANLNTMRKMVLDRLAGLEHEEVDLEQELLGVDNRIEDMQEELEDQAALAAKSPLSKPVTDEVANEAATAAAEFMSESIYEKLPTTPKPPPKRKQRVTRRQSTPILHEHMEPGSRIQEMQAHTDMITALDFDAPFGTMVTAALDDTVRVWDLNANRCMGMLEGHLSSVRCLQVDENIVATGSMDATIKLWDLSKADYAPRDHTIDEDDGLGFSNEGDEPPPPPPHSMRDCPLFTLEAHVAEITALHFRGDMLISGSADKTLRQWDLEKGRCVQTLDVLWAAAQASSSTGIHDGQWRGNGRLPDASADFVGALQCFDAALACGTADGMVRLWDLRSGQVHRSLVGHTGPITALQFDDVHLVTSSLDRSIRVSYTVMSPFDLFPLTLVYRYGTCEPARSTMPTPTTTPSPV